ncbi:MAG: SAM-dependent methyltransferase [Alphaproteobacteria bacterium]|nr:SAM-dependent methyltransferase [Alphaproteobacteria bacterium]MBL7098219.1 SAM-dependent methyltransferase [Alphaproteobacteria bacterium]
MDPALPPRLKEAAEALLEGVSRKDLAAHSTAISKEYRAGGGSARVVRSEADTLAYLVARLPATYAVNAAVLAEVRAAVPDFTPAHLLDVGAGPGTAAWAARETWPALAQATLTDSNASFLDLARKLVPNAEFLPRNLITEALPAADLVIASFVIAEIAEPSSAVSKLYAATTDVLVLIEPGTPQGFARIHAARAQLIAQGANVLAPCTHANACPMTGTDWCHFTQRLPRSRDHMQAKGASVPYEDERYSYLAVSKARRSANEARARILAPPRESKPGIELKLCTPAGLENRSIAKRDKQAFVAVRRAEWSDLV